MVKNPRYVCIRAHAALTCVNRGLALYREHLQALLIGFQAKVGQVLFDLACHLRILVKLLCIEEGTPSDALLVSACLSHIQDGRIGTALAERPEHTHR